MIKAGISFLALVLVAPIALASGSNVHLDQANIDPHDKESILRGAQNYINYCFGCHSISYMRYNRIAKDLGLSEEDATDQWIFTGAKVGDNVKNAMLKDDAKRWFGTAPPDLSVEVRARSVDWIYTYLRSFYADASRPWGVNNAVFKDVAMPHVLWELQGLQELNVEHEGQSEGEGHAPSFTLREKGKLNAEQFDNWVRDTVNFLNYVSEPTKLQRLSLGKWVLAFLLVFWFVVWLLKKEFWKDIKIRS